MINISVYDNILLAKLKSFADVSNKDLRNTQTLLIITHGFQYLNQIFAFKSF